MNFACKYCIAVLNKFISEILILICVWLKRFANHFRIAFYTRKNAQVVTNLQQTCIALAIMLFQQLANRMCSYCLFPACWQVVNGLLATRHKVVELNRLVTRANNLLSSCNSCNNLRVMTTRYETKHLKLGGRGGGAGCRKCNNSNGAFSDWFPLSYTKFPKKRGVFWGSSPLFKAPGLTAFLAFSKANSQTKTSFKTYPFTRYTTSRIDLYPIHTLGAKRMSPVPIFGKILRRVHLLKNTLALATWTCTLRSEIVSHIFLVKYFAIYNFKISFLILYTHV